MGQSNGIDCGEESIEKNTEEMEVEDGQQNVNNDEDDENIDNEMLGLQEITDGKMTGLQERPRPSSLGTVIPQVDQFVQPGEGQGLGNRNENGKRYQRHCFKIWSPQK